MSIDVRVVAATSKNLAEAVSKGEFRDDLFYHLNVLPLNVPPLHERREDIEQLAEFYLDYYAKHEGLHARELSSGARNRLRDYGWTGNVRELKNLIQRLMIMGTTESISANEVSSALGIRLEVTAENALPGFDLPLREARENVGAG